MFDHTAVTTRMCKVFDKLVCGFCECRVEIGPV